MDRGLIYGLFDDSGLRYVGQTIQDLNLRLYQHLNGSSKHKSHLGSWLRSLDEDPIIEIIEECSFENLNKRELSWINEFSLLGCNLVNSMKGCKISGHHTHSDETKRKIGEATKRIHTGMKRSDETKRRISEAAKIRNNIPHKNMYTKEAQAKKAKATSKPVLQFNKEGVLIKEWESATIAGKELNIHNGNIGLCCMGKVKTCGGYQWKYKNLNEY